MTATATRLPKTIRDARVAIARDVLHQLRRRTVPLRLGYGTYLRGTLAAPLALGDDLRAHADAVQRDCEVCLLGACLISKARLLDAVPLAALASGCDDAPPGQVRRINAGRAATRRGLEAVFDRRCMALMESAFEGLDMRRPADGVITYGDVARAVRFGRRHPDRRAKLRAVMLNVIAHAGRFVPPASGGEGGDA